MAGKAQAVIVAEGSRNRDKKWQGNIPSRSGLTNLLLPAKPYLLMFPNCGTR